MYLDMPVVSIQNSSGNALSSWTVLRLSVVKSSSAHTVVSRSGRVKGPSSNHKPIMLLQDGGMGGMTRVRSNTALRGSHWISLLGYVGFRLPTAACEALLWTTTGMARTTEAVLLNFGT